MVYRTNPAHHLFYAARLYSRSQRLFRRHYLEHEAVGLGHGLAANGCKIVDCLVHIVTYYAFGRGDTLAAHGKHGRHHGRGDTRRDFKRARRLRSVAYHTGEVGNHILYRRTYLPVTASHQIDQSARGTGGGNHTAAQRRQTPEALLDIDRGEV